MMGKSHMVFGAGSTVATLAVVGVAPADHGVIYLSAIAIGVFASLMPDMDGANSTFWNVIGMGPKQANKSCVGAVLHFFVKALTALIPHRGPSHYLVTWLAVSAVFFALLMVGHLFFGEHLILSYVVVWSLAFSVGYLSHLVADSCTRSGLYLLRPFSDQKVYLLPYRFRIRTGSMAETFLLGAMVIVCVVVTLSAGWVHQLLI